MVGKRVARGGYLGRVWKVEGDAVLVEWEAGTPGLIFGAYDADELTVMEG